MSKQTEIVNMFNSIAKSYDLVNRILSFGIDKQWRKKAILESLELINKENISVLDVACGTGDMIESFLKYKNDINIIGLDPSKEMLKIAKEKLPNIKFIQGYATDLPFENNTFDIVSISFGIRNVVDTQKAIEEFYRVLNKKGILLILEFTKSNGENTLRKCVDFYTNKFSPVIGGLFSKNKKAYEYLPKSIENFYTKDMLCKLIEKEGFVVKKAKNFNFGQVSMIIAQKL